MTEAAKACLAGPPPGVLPSHADPGARDQEALGLLLWLQASPDDIGGEAEGGWAQSVILRLCWFCFIEDKNKSTVASDEGEGSNPALGG